MMNGNDSDAEVIRSFLTEREETFFDILYDRYAPKVYGRCIMILYNPADAEEALQDVFVKVYFQLETLKSAEAFKTWLYRLTTNVCLNQIQKNQKQKEILIEDTEQEFESDESNPLQKLLEIESSDKIQKTFKTLKPEESVLLFMKYLDDKSIKEIAAEIEISEANTKVKIHRAKQSFITIFNNLE